MKYRWKIDAFAFYNYGEVESNCRYPTKRDVEKMLRDLDMERYLPKDNEDWWLGFDPTMTHIIIVDKDRGRAIISIDLIQ